MTRKKTREELRAMQRETVRYLYAAKGLTYSEIAHMIGCSVSTISRLMSKDEDVILSTHLQLELARLGAHHGCPYIANEHGGVTPSKDQMVAAVNGRSITLTIHIESDETPQRIDRDPMQRALPFASTIGATQRAA